MLDQVDVALANRLEQLECERAQRNRIRELEATVDALEKRIKELPSTKAKTHQRERLRKTVEERPWTKRTALEFSGLI